MINLEQLETAMKPFAASIVAMLLLGAFLWAVHWLLSSRAGRVGNAGAFQRQIIMVLLTGLGCLVVILALPIADSLRNHLLALLGILISGIIGLSSTTLVANGMAGLMLRSVKSFHSGDFIRVGAHCGRVTERGLFHTEIQTEDRELTTLPIL